MPTERFSLVPAPLLCSEADTTHIFRTLGNTARVFKNKVANEVVRLERRPGGAKFEDLRELVSGARGRTVYETGDVDAGVWSAGVCVGLIEDVPTCQALLDRIEQEAEELITGRLTSMVVPSAERGVALKAKL